MQLILYILGFIALIFGLVVFRGAPYLPAHKSAINNSLILIKNLKLSKGEVIVDLGSGDGKFLSAASKSGYRVVGYELNPILYLITRLRFRKNNNVEVHIKDFWNAELPDKTKVVYVFLLDKFMDKLDKKMQNEANKLDKDLLLLSYAFKVTTRAPISQSDGVRLYSYKPHGRSGDDMVSATH